MRKSVMVLDRVSHHWLVNGFFLLILALLSQNLHAQEGGYLFGVFPHLSAGQIDTMFAPIAADFSKALGRPVALKTKPTFEAFTEELDNQVYDIAFIQPFDYVKAHDKYGYMPLARRGEPLVGLMVVKPDSPLNSWQDLKGKKIGLPPEVAAVSHLTKMALLKEKINPKTDVTLMYFKTHDSCLQKLLIGEIDACGTAAFPVRFFESKWDVKFKVMAKTQPISHALFVVHPRVPKKDRALILKTIFEWDKTDEGRQLLKRAELKPFEKVTDSEYNDVRKYLRAMQKK